MDPALCTGQSYSTFLSRRAQRWEPVDGARRCRTRGAATAALLLGILALLFTRLDGSKRGMLLLHTGATVREHVRGHPLMPTLPDRVHSSTAHSPYPRHRMMRSPARASVFTSPESGVEMAASTVGQVGQLVAGTGAQALACAVAVWCGLGLGWSVRKLGAHQKAPWLSTMAASGEKTAGEGGGGAAAAARRLQKANMITSAESALPKVAAQMWAQCPEADVVDLVAAALEYPLDDSLETDLTAFALRDDDLKAVVVAVLESYDRGDMPDPSDEAFPALYDRWLHRLAHGTDREGPDIRPHVQLALTGRCAGPAAALQLQALAVAEEQGLPSVPLSQRMAALREKTLGFSRRNALLTAGAGGLVAWQATEVVKGVRQQVTEVLQQRRRGARSPAFDARAKRGMLSVGARSALLTAGVGGLSVYMSEGSKAGIWGRPRAYTRRVAETLRAVTGGHDVRRVLELGIGCSTTNLQRGYYPPGIELYGVDPQPPEGEELATARAAADKYGIEGLTLRRGVAEDLREFPDGFFDAVVCTFTFCTVADPEKAVAEVRRVLRPGGRFGFVEHVAVTEEEARQSASSRVLQVSQRMLDPFQKVVANGCSLCRESDRLIAAAFAQAPQRDVERFVVPEMWPVSQFCVGVVTKELAA